MGTLITTSSLLQSNACPEAYDFFTESFCISGSEFYVSGSNHECYFEDNITYHYTCSNSNEISWLVWAANTFKITGSFYNSETNISQYYHKTTMDYTVSGSE